MWFPYSNEHEPQKLCTVKRHLINSYVEKLKGYLLFLINLLDINVYNFENWLFSIVFSLQSDVSISTAVKPLKA